MPQKRYRATDSQTGETFAFDWFDDTDPTDDDIEEIAASRRGQKEPTSPKVTEVSADEPDNWWSGFLRAAPREIGKEALDRSWSGFASNLGRDVVETGKGFASLVGMAADPRTPKRIAEGIVGAVRDPRGAWESVKGAGRAIGADLAEWRDPVKRVYEKPLTSGLDVSGLLTGGGTTAARMGATRSGAALVKAGDLANPVGQAMRGTGFIAQRVPFFSPP